MVRALASAIFAALLIGATTITAAAPEIPALPDPVPVTVDRNSTALLLVDLTPSICLKYPTCVDELPILSRLLGRARDAGIFVIHNTTGSVPEVAPLESETLVEGAAGSDKFSGSTLDEELQAHGIKTIILAAWAVLFTGYDAAVHGYTIILPQEGAQGAAPFDSLLTPYVLLTYVGTLNPDNQPLKERAVTLTRADLISFG